MSSQEQDEKIRRQRKLHDILFLNCSSQNVTGTRCTAEWCSVNWLLYSTACTPQPSFPSLLLLWAPLPPSPGPPFALNSLHLAPSSMVTDCQSQLWQQFLLRFWLSPEVGGWTEALWFHTHRQLLPMLLTIVLLPSRKWKWKHPVKGEVRSPWVVFCYGFRGYEPRSAENWLILKGTPAGFLQGSRGARSEEKWHKEKGREDDKSLEASVTNITYTTEP